LTGTFLTTAAFGAFPLVAATFGALALLSLAWTAFGAAFSTFG